MMVSNRSMEKIRAIVKKWRRFACSQGTCDSQQHAPSDPPVSSCGDRADNIEEVVVSQEENGFVPVYVGRTRRRYVISSKNLNHPLLRILIKRSEEEDELDGYSVACEVVLFDHLLWMLKNEDPLLSQADSLEELVDFYAC